MANIQLASFTHTSGVQSMGCKSALCQGQASAYNAQSCACREMVQGTRLYLGLIGAWRGPTEEWAFPLSKSPED